MKYDIRFVDEIEDDLLNAYQWYQSKSSELGVDMLDEIYKKFDQVLAAPQIYQKVFKEFRRALLNRFPLSVYYLIENDFVVIYGVFHTRQDLENIEVLLSNR